MPIQSQQQWKFLFATDKPFARRWAHETPGGKGTRFRKLPVKVRTKAPNYSAKRGQTIAGRLVRGEGGRFSSSGAGSSATSSAPAKAPAVKPKGRKAPKLAKPRQTPEQRAAEREQKRLANRATVDKALGLTEDTIGALEDLRAGKAVEDDGGLVKLGLAEQARDGSYRLTAAGRALASARDAGDVGRARDTMSRAADRYAAGQDRAAAQRERQGKKLTAAMVRATQQPKPAKVGGGGGSKKKPPVVRRVPARSSSRPQAARPAGGGGGASESAKPELPANLVAAARALSAGQAADEELLIRNGLAKRGKDGRLTLTAQGLRAIRTKATTDRERGWTVAHQAIAQWEESFGRWVAPVPSFAVFKDASGAYRWIARTTTAFEDRDEEVISTKALEQSAASPDPRGPLRFWHMGRPDPLSKDAPWGPGVDLGWCDFAATHGRTLIESGTFKSEAIARAVAAKADQLELSPGFFHAPMEPDASRVFHHIRIFERSLVPKWAGRASNPYTGLVVEKAMDPKKVEALKEMGIDAATLRTLLTDIETTEKSAEVEGVRYKEAETPPAELSFAARLKAFLAPEPPEPEPVVTKAAEPAPDPIAALTAQVAALAAEVATLKAGPPAEVIAETQADEAMVEVETDAEMPIEDDMGGGELSADEFLAAIGAVLDAKLGPLVEALGITTKLDGHMGELKSLLSGFATQKDDERAQLTARLDQTDAKLAELVGDAPRVGYRASQASDNTAAALLETLKDAPDGANPHPFADLVGQIFPTIGARQ